MNFPSGEERRRTGRSALPQVDAVLRSPAAAVVVDRHGRESVRDAVRARITIAREEIGGADSAPSIDEILQQAASELDTSASAAVRQVINATGVVLHTNLGRAPLSDAARRAVMAASGYSTVEFDLSTGGRGSRTRYSASLAARLVGSEDAHIVNNGAAALLLAVAALGAGREVIVSRGELVEIGDSFRLPDVVAVSGARLVEVGTTNRTRLSDYTSAIGPSTGLILKVHRSNFRVVGFTEEVGVPELSRLSHEHGVPMVLDAGSGLVDDSDLPVLSHEPPIRRAIDDGADLVVFSGDKLLGGPQAGILAGRTDLIARCRRNPIARALRIDKLQIAALETTLEAHLRDGGVSGLPTVRMLNAPLKVLQARASNLRRSLREACDACGVPGVRVRTVVLESAVGGGSAAGMSMTSAGVAIDFGEASLVLRLLRMGAFPIVARIIEEEVVLDLRTVQAEQDLILPQLIAGALLGAASLIDEE